MSKFDAILVNVDGSVTQVSIDGYRDIQAAVGGTFDMVSSTSGETSFWIHDEGKLIGLQMNVVASAVLWQLNEAFVGRDLLFGPVLIAGGADHYGDTLSVGPEATRLLKQLNAAV